VFNVVYVVVSAKSRAKIDAESPRLWKAAAVKWGDEPSYDSMGNSPKRGWQWNEQLV